MITAFLACISSRICMAIHITKYDLKNCRQSTEPFPAGTKLPHAALLTNRAIGKEVLKCKALCGPSHSSTPATQPSPPVSGRGSLLVVAYCHAALGRLMSRGSSGFSTCLHSDIPWQPTAVRPFGPSGRLQVQYTLLFWPALRQSRVMPHNRLLPGTPRCLMPRWHHTIHGPPINMFMLSTCICSGQWTSGHSQHAALYSVEDCCSAALGCLDSCNSICATGLGHPSLELLAQGRGYSRCLVLLHGGPAAVRVAL